MRKLLMLLLLLSTAPAYAADPIAQLRKFTVEDLQAALDDAKAQNPPDAVAAACYEALIPVVQGVSPNVLPKKLGAFQAFQKARDLSLATANVEANLQNGPLVTACGPLVLSAQQTILMLGAKVALPIK